MTAFRRELEQASGASGVVLEPGVLEACGVHFDLLLRWNKTHNLTRIVDPAEAARKHYLDCLVPLLALRDQGVQPGAFVDVGSGAGFPGLLAALVWPDAKAILWEPAQKRLSFLMLAAGAMGLKVTAVPPATTRAPSAAPGPLPVSAPTHASLEGAVLVLSRATFSDGKRGELLRAAQDAIAVWGHPYDGSTWKNEVATWPGWGASLQNYAVDGLEPRAILWANRGEFHVKHSHPIL